MSSNDEAAAVRFVNNGAGRVVGGRDRAGGAFGFDDEVHLRTENRPRFLRKGAVGVILRGILLAFAAVVAIIDMVDRG